MCYWGALGKYMTDLCSLFPGIWQLWTTLLVIRKGEHCQKMELQFDLWSRNFYIPKVQPFKKMKKREKKKQTKKEGGRKEGRKKVVIIIMRKWVIVSRQHSDGLLREEVLLKGMYTGKAITSILCEMGLLYWTGSLFSDMRHQASMFKKKVVWWKTFCLSTLITIGTNSELCCF